MRAPIKKIFTFDPFEKKEERQIHQVQNLIKGEWTKELKENEEILDPISGEVFLRVPNTTDFSEYIKNLDRCPKSGLHNPIKNPDRYLMLGEVSRNASRILKEKSVEQYFCKLIQRVMPKSDIQCLGEVEVTRVFLENFSGDNVRFLARSFSNPGNYLGQETSGYRWPFGSVCIIAPFNFPLEIPVLQVMGELVKRSKNQIRLLQFTGSKEVAQRLSLETFGKIKIEDAGFDGKIIGPDYDPKWAKHVAWQCDEDAYNASGQKCSAQSFLFVHKNWEEDLLPRLKELASKRKLENLDIGPILTWTNHQITEHIDCLLTIPGSKVLFGGKKLLNNSIPPIYGSFQPTALEIPIDKILGDNFKKITKEVFGPFQIIVVYEDKNMQIVKKTLENISQNLTAAVVSNDVVFQQEILASTVNGTTYSGMKARTTGAPQNHWFGPSGDPRSAGIGTPEAIISTWSSHREIIKDVGPL